MENPDVVADYEEVSEAVYNVIVTATDVSAGGVGASSNPQPIMMHLTDVNETPTIAISGATNGIINVSEDSDVATSLATITTDDDDGHTVTLSVDNANFYFTQTGAGTGVFELFANSLDHETDDQMVVNITASDGVKSLSKQLTVNVDDVNETPEFGLPVGGTQGPISLANKTMEFSISENANVGDIVTTLAASDEDDGHTPILSPSMYSTFNISSVGELVLIQRLIMKQNNQLI